MKHRHIRTDAHARAMARVRVLAHDARADLAQLAQQALADLRSCTNSPQAWRNMVDVISLSEELSRLGICSDEETLQISADAREALGAIHDRQSHRATWALRPAEMAALGLLVERWAIQLQFVSVGELDRATRNVAARMRQALAGNAAPGTRVVGVAP